MQPRNVVGRTNTQMKQMIEVQNIIVLCMLAQSFKICHNVYMPCVIAQMYLPNTREHQGFRTRITCSRHAGGYFCHANVKKYLSYGQNYLPPRPQPSPLRFPKSDLRSPISSFGFHILGLVSDLLFPTLDIRLQSASGPQPSADPAFQLRLPQKHIVFTVESDLGTQPMDFDICQIRPNSTAK